MKPASVLKEKVAARKAKRAREEEESRNELIALVWEKMDAAAECGYSYYEFPKVLYGRAKKDNWSPPEYRLTADTVNMIMKVIDQCGGYTFTLKEDSATGGPVFTVLWE
ncbi:MAG: hypothetical protein K2Q45_05395 [Nitrosomonas sp.]|nr:hypothetical protein [Nitrosomonas sp.]